MIATAAMAMATASIASPAWADEPGVAEQVYGATVEKGLTEFEARYGRLNGGNADGEDGLIFEAEHGFSRRFAGALLIQTGRDANGQRQTRGIAFEGIHTIGSIRPLKLDVAGYGEYRIGLNGEPDEIEGKLLLQHRAGGFDARLNLKVDKEFAAHQPVEFGYAASADWRIIGDEFKLGVAAFGGLGSTRKFLASDSHFIGPVAKVEIEHIGPGDIEIEGGWLRAFGRARSETDGQARLLISYELRF